MSEDDDKKLNDEITIVDANAEALAADAGEPVSAPLELAQSERLDLGPAEPTLPTPEATKEPAIDQSISQVFDLSTAPLHEERAPGPMPGALPPTPTAAPKPAIVIPRAVPAAPIPTPAPAPATPPPMPSMFGTQTATPMTTTAAPTAVTSVPTQTSPNADFNIFDEKTRVAGFSSSTNSSGEAKAEAGGVKLFDDKTVVRTESLSKIVAKKSSQKPPKHHAVDESSYHQDEDLDSQTQSGFALKLPLRWPANFPRIEFSRNKIVPIGGALVVLLVLFHFFFSSHNPAPAPVVAHTEQPKPAAQLPAKQVQAPVQATAAAPHGELRTTASKDFAKAVAAADGVMHQTSIDLYWRFHAAMDKNQNFGREPNSP